MQRNMWSENLPKFSDIFAQLLRNFLNTVQTVEKCLIKTITALKHF